MHKKLAVYVILVAFMSGWAYACTVDPFVNGPSKAFRQTPVSSVYRNFPKMPIPVDNPLTAEKIRLGRRLFYDPILSGDSTLSCSSCHLQKNAFSDPNQFSIGIDKIFGNRNAMTLSNVAFGHNGFFWDGRAPSLELQSAIPVSSFIELHQDMIGAAKKLQRQPEYIAYFDTAFGTRKITADLIEKAIASFERTLVSHDSKYDKWRRGEYTPSYTEEQGYKLFLTEKANCWHCHFSGGSVSDLFTTGSYANNGLDSAVTVNDFRDPGLGRVTGMISDYGKFKTPSLRNLAYTAPYMHDGRFKTLNEVIDHYNYHAGIKWSPTLTFTLHYPPAPHMEGTQLDSTEKHQLLDFLNMLNDSVFVNNKEFSNPF